MLHGDKEYIELLNNLCSLINENQRKKVLHYTSSSARVGGIMDLVRNSIISSDMYVYNDMLYSYSARLGIYTPIPWNMFNNIVYDLLIRLELPSSDMTRINSITNLCTTTLRGKPLKLDNEIMVFSNGVYDFRTKKLSSYSPNFFQISRVDYRFDARVFHPMWDVFLEDVLPNPMLQELLQMFLGCLFIDRKRVKIEAMLILLGSGSNGKSVIFETINGLLGEDNVSNIGLSALISGSESKRNIAFINGKRLNYCSEIQMLEIGRNSDVLKSLISGEPLISRAMYKENATARDIPLLMANANKLPSLTDSSHGMHRRLVIIPFEVEIEESRQDKMLSTKLRSEYTGILNWIIEGRDKFIKNDYKFPDLGVIEDLVFQYENEVDSGLRFMASQGYLRNGDKTCVYPYFMKTSVLYSQYKKWCIEENVHPDTQNLFTRKLRREGFQFKRHYSGNMIGVFGDIVREMNRREAAKDKQLAIKQKNSVPSKWGRRKIICGLDNAAYYAGYSSGTIGKMMDEGLLNDCFTFEDRMYIFDVEALDLAIEEARKANKLPERRLSAKLRDGDMAAMRGRFNHEMKSLGLPYRKYKNKRAMRSEGIVFVDDNVVLTDYQKTPEYVWDNFGIKVEVNE